MMKQENIRNYAELMKELELSALEITEGDKKIRLERTSSSQTLLSAPLSPWTAPVSAPAESTPAASPAPASGHPITSPMVGVFYCAPAENADPFVQVGDRVNVGDTVGIIESMKLMNEVISDVAGTVEEICVSNGETVDYGRVLLRVKAD